ncbi:hypothetical protein QBC42DRAFT_331329 [Cladorrhinum samala]|uniref:Uncharacterized protein n=1 Tax=Cladorrhinum samala TaxID=585594 RepID=A0AAV9HJ55_9PEZI|nr:hypothetical protein QBC42DRAFT_331329 [Cladorrhinum samala]
MSTLPTLPASGSPQRFPQSCASISLGLLDLLDGTLPPPPSISLSVGSGPGLLEALFLRRFPSRSRYFFGVEVVTPPGRQKVNRFLAEENVIEVRGTWAKVGPSELEERLVVGGSSGVGDGGAENDDDDDENEKEGGGEKGKRAEVKGLVFCYPRQVGLVREYLAESEAVEVVVWIGPRCDEDSFGPALEAWGDRMEDEEARGVLVEDGEVVVVYRRR